MSRLKTGSIIPSLSHFHAEPKEKIPSKNNKLSANDEATPYIQKKQLSVK
jgi:hypothetical protein